MEYETILAKYNNVQLKKILKENAVKGYSTKKKTELIQMFKENDIDIKNLPPIEKTQRTENLLKRYGKKAYNVDEQNEFIDDGYDVEDPLLSKKEYLNPKTGNTERLKLQDHQKAFIRKFYMSNNQGAVIFHGVGTGKTLTAVASSHYYLSMYPTHNVVILSPPSIIFNFIDSMQAYGLDIRDSRYKFFSYDKFIRRPFVNDKTLIIIDEAHNFRTKMTYSRYKDEKDNEKTTVTSNKRGYWILDAIKKCHKALMLTGTPFINKIYDIENLISMCEKKDPLDENNFAAVCISKKQRDDYFKYKISHYENPTNSEFFPKVHTKYIPIVMSTDDEEIYNKVKSNPIISNEEYDEIFGGAEGVRNIGAYMSGVRQLSDVLGDYKVNWVLELLEKEEDTQTIIYSNYISVGLKKIIKKLNDNGISYAVISGSENANEREDARVKYNNRDIRVLLISKAGTEGIDTRGTRNVIIYEGSLWNEGTISQAIARGVRFKSHYHLKKEEQYVNVYRLILCKKSDVSIIDKINNNKIVSYSNEMASIKLKQQKLNKLFNMEKKKDIEEMDEDDKKKYSEMKFNKFEVQNTINGILKTMPSIEVYLTIMSLAKMSAINSFIQTLDKEILQVEDYKDKKLEKKLKNEDEEKHYKIIKEYYKDQYNNIYDYLKNDNNVLKQHMDKVTARYKKMLEKSRVKVTQEFFTPSNIVKKMLSYSEKLKTYGGDLSVLEPTAGVGNIVHELILKGNENMEINMVEIQNDNREVLQKLCDKYDKLNLYQEGDFLKFINPCEYDLIIMNPPYHLRKKYFPNLDRDYYDYDFVKKAYSMLKEDGELIALCRLENTNRMLEWYKGKNSYIYELTNQKWKGDKEGDLSKINKINLAIIVMYKKDDDMKDKKLLVDNNTENFEEKVDDVVENYAPIKNYAPLRRR